MHFSYLACNKPNLDPCIFYQYSFFILHFMIRWVSMIFYKKKSLINIANPFNFFKCREKVFKSEMNVFCDKDEHVIYFPIILSK